MTKSYYRILLFFCLLQAPYAYAQNQTDLEATAEKANQLFLEGKEAADKQELSKSITLFEESIALYKHIYVQEDERLANIYATIGNLYAKHHEGIYAIEYCTKAIEYLKEDTPLNKLKRGKLYYAIAELYREQNLRSLSLEFFKESIQQFNQAKDYISHKEKLLALLQAGKLSYELQDYNQAIYFYREALPVASKISDVQAREHAIIFHNLGNSYLNTNDVERAIESFNKTVEINKKLYGPHSKEAIDSYHSLVNAYFVDGEFEKTWDISHKILDMYQRNIAEPEIKEELIQYCYTQARNHIHIRAYHTASHWYQKYFEAKYNAYHPKAIESIDEFIEVGNLFAYKSTLTHALIFYKMGLEYYEQIDTNQKNTLANIAYKIGNLYWNMKMPFKSYDFFKKSLNVYKDTNDTKAADCFAKLAHIYKMQGQKMAQINSLFKSFEILEKKGFKAKSAIALKEIAETYYYYHQYDSALVYARKLLNTYNSYTSHKEIKNAYILLANIYNAKEDITLALEYYNKVLLSDPEVFEKQINPFTLEANQNLYEIFSHIGDTDKAKKHANNAQKMRKELQGLENTPTLRQFNNTNAPQ